MSDASERSSTLGIAGRIAHAFIDSKLTPLIIITAVLLGIARDRPAAARGGAADQGADGRCDGEHGRLQREGSRGTRDAPDGKAALGNPRRGIHLLHFARQREPRHRALQGRLRSRGEPRAAHGKAALELRPHPARRRRAADQAEVDRRRADPRAHFPQRALRSSHAAPAGGGGGRRGESRAARRGDERSSAARGAQVRVLLDPVRLASRNLSAAGLVPMLQQANRQYRSGGLTTNNQEVRDRNRRVSHQRGGRGQCGRRRLRRPARLSARGRGDRGRRGGAVELHLLRPRRGARLRAG